MFNWEVMGRNIHRLSRNDDDIKDAIKHHHKTFPRDGPYTLYSFLYVYKPMVPLVDIDEAVEIEALPNENS